MFLFYETREKTNRQRKVFKSLVICNYASKKKLQQIIQLHTVSQTEQTENTRNASIFCFCLTRLSPVFFVRAWEKNSCNSSRATFMGFSFSCHWKKGCQTDRSSRQHQPVSSADWFHFLFEIFRLSHTMFTHKNRLFQNVKKKNIKKETELYYSTPLCPL